MTTTDVCSRSGSRNLNSSPRVQKINGFLTTPQYILVIMLLAALSSLFSLELVVYGLFVALAVYVCVFGEDLLPLMPLVMVGYVTPSARNNPGRAADSVFFPGHGGNLIIAYAVILVIAVLYRLIRDRKQYLSQKYGFLWGMIVLAVGYLLSGIGSNAYPAAIWQNLRYALVQIGAIIVPYVLFAGGVKWENARKDYFAWTGLLMGCLILMQEAWAYATGNVVLNGIIERRNLYTGWGMHNNIGGMLAMMIPSVFYLATKYSRGWIGILGGSAILVGIVLTCSRSSILMASFIYIVCLLVMLYRTKNRKKNSLVLGVVIGVILLLCLVCHKQLLKLFSELIKRGTDPSGRDVIYVEGARMFREYPIFGSSFFSPGYRPWEWSTTDFSGFLPARWHNTVIQLLVSCGVVGLIAYCVHRYQTIRFFLKDRTPEKNLIGLTILVLILCSLLDCHFFNIGPVLLYSTGLAFAENIHKSTK